MTTFNLVDIYLFDYISTAHRKELNLCGCCSMVEEMNEIRKLYNTSGRKIKDVLTKCVCNRHGHQYCIPEDAVKDAVDKLLKSRFCSDSLIEVPLVNKGKFTNKFKDFEELYDFIRSVIGNVKGIGLLTIYDTARRIGHLLDTPVYPKEYIYLAAGAKTGAENLLNLKRNSLKFREPTKIFFPYFGTLPSAFIEDILCIFEDDLKDLSNKAVKDVIKKAVKLLNSKEIIKIV